jgi:hypothetical protein
MSLEYYELDPIMLIVEWYSMPIRQLVSLSSFSREVVVPRAVAAMDPTNICHTYVSIP